MHIDKTRKHCSKTLTQWCKSRVTNGLEKLMVKSKACRTRARRWDMWFSLDSKRHRLESNNRILTSSTNLSSKWSHCQVLGLKWKKKRLTCTKMNSWQRLMSLRKNWLKMKYRFTIRLCHRMKVKGIATSNSLNNRHNAKTLQNHWIRFAMNLKPIYKKYLKMCSTKRIFRDLGAARTRKVKRIDEAKTTKRLKKY